MASRYPRWGKVFHGGTRFGKRDVRLQWKYVSQHKRVLYRNRKKTSTVMRRLNWTGRWA